MLVRGRMRMRLAAANAVAAILVVAAIAPLTARAAPTPDPPAVPPGFTLAATNGYSLTVLGFREEEEDEAAAYLIVEGPGSVVYYYTRDAEVTETSIKADLGSVAHIDMSFEATGEEKFQKTACEGGPVPLDSGRWKGSFWFRGEEGYAEADSASARGDIKYLLHLVCADAISESVSSQFPGASLRAARGPKALKAGSEATRVSVQANKNHRRGRTLISASIEERSGSLSVLRGVFGRYRSGAFRYGRTLGTASLHPPAPFSGSASYRRRGERPSIWIGTLKADFPGNSDVALAGPGFEAGVVHARVGKRQIDRYD